MSKASELLKVLEGKRIYHSTNDKRDGYSELEILPAANKYRLIVPVRLIAGEDNEDTEFTISADIKRDEIIYDKNSIKIIPFDSETEEPATPQQASILIKWLGSHQAIADKIIEVMTR